MLWLWYKTGIHCMTLYDFQSISLTKFLKGLIVWRSIFLHKSLQQKCLSKLKRLAFTKTSINFVNKQMLNLHTKILILICLLLGSKMSSLAQQRSREKELITFFILLFRKKGGGGETNYFPHANVRGCTRYLRDRWSNESIFPPAKHFRPSELSPDFVLHPKHSSVICWTSPQLSASTLIVQWSFSSCNPMEAAIIQFLNKCHPIEQIPVFSTWWC